MSKRITNMKKKIIFLDQNLNGGGAERVLCTIMRALSPDAFDIHLLLVGTLGEIGFLIPPYIVIHELKISNTRKALLATIKKIRRIRPDIIYTTLNRTTILSIIAKAFCPHYLAIARYPNMPSKEIESAELRGWRLILQKHLYRYADIVVAQTEEMATELKSIVHINEKKIRTIHNPIDTSYIQNSLVGAMNPFRVDKTNIVASGRIVPVKGFDILLGAMAQLVKINPNIVLHIIGKDLVGLQSSLKKKAIKLGVQANIHFLGFQPNPYPFYKYCDAFVLSSRYEGMPNALIECLYLKTPVVATRCVPIVERLVRDGVDGYLVDVGDEMGLSAAIIKSLELKLCPRQNKFSNDNIEKLIKLFR